jgi:PAS domain S-box-containing protein
MEPAARRKIPEGTELLSLIIAVLVVSVVAGLSYQTWISFNSGSVQLETTRQIVRTTNALLSAMKDAETGQRGYLLTGDDRYLAPYLQALNDIPVNLKLLADAAPAGSPAQSRRAQALRPLIGDKLDELKQTIELRQNKGFDAAAIVVETDRGKVAMDQIRTLCAEILAEATDGLTRYSRNTRSSAHQLGLVSTFGSVGLFVLLVFSTVTIQRVTRRRQQLIHDLRESEAKIKEARDWLQTTIGSIGDAVIATDAHGNVTILNGVSESLTGWQHEHAVGAPLETVFIIGNEETGEPMENPVGKVLREGRIVGLANHTVLTSRDGRKIPIDDSAAPIRDSSGNIIGVVLVFRDITERRKVELQEQRSAAALSVQAELLARTNADLEQFAYAASHDLQEPLRMITTYSQLLLKGYRGQLEGEAGLCVQYIADGSKRMRDLLADLLAYTQLSMDGQESSEIADLGAVYEEALHNLKAAIEENAAVVTSDPLPVVHGREAHLIQLFQNLIGNSIKYRSDSPPRVHVAAEQQNGRWRFAVSDNGIGIDPLYQQQIFGVFKRLHGKQIPGTGIGLAICQRVVERGGGRIWVDSQPNRGATFYFTLPQGPA